MGFARCLCNTKAKLAIKDKIRKELIYEKPIQNHKRFNENMGKGIPFARCGECNIIQALQ